MEATALFETQSETQQQTDNYAKHRDVGELQKSLAPVTTADLFKRKEMLERPCSKINARIFMSREACLRQPSSLKAGCAGLPQNIISLSTGRPSPKYYPFLDMEFNFLHPNPDTLQLNDLITTNSDSCALSHKTTIARRDPNSTIDLSIALSYGYSLGHEQLIQFLTTHISYIHSPPYSDWDVCLTIGNTSALEIAFRNLVDPGDCILVEENTYSGTIEAAKALNIILIPIRMDVDGICPNSLDETLSSWSVRGHNKRKPKILYTIPTGQNPTGTTQPLERRLAVLEVAEQHNLLIIEDDPYYYLQFPTERWTLYTQNLLPSYLALCKTGRVLRLDTTSKILAPGLRLGWVTAPKAIIEAFQASHDLGIVHPSGLSQAIIYKLLSETWGHGGFEQWLWNLATLYQQQATVIVRALAQCFGMGPLSEICSWNTITAGMFIWLKVNCRFYPRLAYKVQKSGPEDTIRLEIEDEIYNAAIKNGVLCCKGSFFEVAAPLDSVANNSNEKGSFSQGREISEMNIHFRLTFASVEAEKLVQGVEALAQAIMDVFEV